MITPSFSLTATERVLPKLALDFTTAALDSRVTFTRTTDATHPATYVNSSGYVTAATNNQPRFDYDATTLTCKGLLIEESRSNLLTYSEDMFTGWNKSRLDVTTDYILGPDNTTSGNYLLCNTTSVNGMNVSQTSLTFSGSALTASFFIKKGYDNYAVAILYDNASNGVRQWFNVNTGAVASSNTFGTGWAKTNATITPYPNGWYRCTLSVSTTGTACAFVIGPSTPSDLGFGCTSGVTYGYLWGAQLEASSFATSYIPTTLLPLTRNADVATMTGTNFSDWWNQTEGTFSVVASAPAPVSPNGNTALSFNDNTISNFAVMGQFLFDGVKAAAVVTAGSTVVNMFTAGVQANIVKNSCFAYETNNFVSSLSGDAVKTDTAGTIGTMTQLAIGRLVSQQWLNGHIESINYWPQRLTNAEVQAFAK